MARPKKDEAEKKSYRINISCTKEQKALIIQKAKIANLTLSPFILKCGLNQEIKARMNSFDKETLLIVSGIGNNLNQLAKVFNSAGYDSENIRQVIKEVENLKQSLRKQ